MSVKVLVFHIKGVYFVLVRTGFTSMVPELSRSAEPLWNLRRTTPGPLPETPNSPISRYESIAIANLH